MEWTGTVVGSRFEIDLHYCGSFCTEVRGMIDQFSKTRQTPRANSRNFFSEDSLMFLQSNYVPVVESVFKPV